MFATVPIAFLIIITSRGIQKRLGTKQSEAKLAASKQTQEYIEGIKVIRACGLDGEQFSALEEALRTLQRLAIRFEFSGAVFFITGAQVVLQAGTGIVVFVGSYLITGGGIAFFAVSDVSAYCNAYLWAISCRANPFTRADVSPDRPWTNAAADGHKNHEGRYRSADQGFFPSALNMLVFIITKARMPLSKT